MKILPGCLLIVQLAAIPCLSTETDPRDRWTPVQLSLFEPYQLFSKYHTVYGFRFNLLFGSSRLVRGIDVGLVNHAGGMMGAQVGGFNFIDRTWNDFRDEAGGDFKHSGVFQAGLANYNHWDFYGIQLGAVFNFSGGLYGIQVSPVNFSLETMGFQAGIYNSPLDFYGVQAGVVNDVSSGATQLFMMGGGGMHGIQLGALNRARHVDGVQIGAINRGSVDGMQLAVLLNTGGGVTGTQVGFINIANRTKGLQIGVINYTRQMYGVQIGVINIIREGAVPFLPIINASFSL
ncbi:MAG: hypothetical protein KBA61_05310 [Spirochaetes bacterium]|nr:hypothetical protein [Spirochaetota bacterium]